MRRHVAVAVLMVTGLFAARAEAQQETSTPSSAVRQSLDDAWWTGPILTNSAGTLPRGHFLIEPYLYDVIADHTNGFGSRTYVLYGLADRFTIGSIAIAGFNEVSDGLSSSSVGMGDFTSLAQYRLTQFHAGSWTPTTSFEVQEAFPTGKYDRLGNRPSDGLGSGAFTTTLGLNSQTYFWMPNGRILRMRFNASETLSNEVSVEDVSVYGTAAGFRGHAQPGRSFFIYASLEYSLTRRWVLALDTPYSHGGNTRTIGYEMLDLNIEQNPPSIRLNSGSSDSFGFAPAVEYSWKPNLGVVFGARVIGGGHNTAISVAPVVAINFVH